MVGSLFSKRPRVIGSNCKISCLACTNFSAGGFGSFTGSGFFFGTIKRGAGAGFLILGSGSTGGGSIGAGSANETKFSSMGSALVLIGSDTMSILGGGGGGCSQIGGGGARIGSLIADIVCGAISPSATSELIIVTLKRFPILPSTAVPK